MILNFCISVSWRVSALSNSWWCALDSLLWRIQIMKTLGLGEVLHQKVYADPRDVARLLVPAGLYTVQNNLAYFAMSHLVSYAYM